MFQFDYTKPLDENIAAYLADARLKYPTIRVQVFRLYTDLKNAITSPSQEQYDLALPQYRKFELPVGIFNKTIGDMKKVGIIKTARDSQQVFLSDAAWDDYKKSLKNADLFDALTEVLISAGVFTSHKDMRERAVAGEALSTRPDGKGGYIFQTDNPIYLWEWLREEARQHKCEYLAVDFLRAHVWLPTADVNEPGMLNSDASEVSSGK